MKILETNSSYPGFSDTLVVYQGETPVSVCTAEDKAIPYTVTTEIRTGLFVNILGVHQYTEEQFSVPFRITITNDKYIITFQVPNNFKAYYYISGSTALTEDANKELTTGSEVAYTYINLSHSHRGTTGRQITPTNLVSEPSTAGMVIGTSADGNYITYYPYEPVANVPVFTLPALNNPANWAIIDFKTGVPFDWDAATNMINTDSYTLKIVDYEDPETFWEHTVAGDVLSHEVDTAVFRQGAQYAWFVIATNATGTAVSETRMFGIPAA